MKKLTCIFMIFSLLLTLVSCSNETEKVAHPKETKFQTPVVFEHKGQEFKIHTYYQEFEDFLESAKKQPEKVDELYRQSVVEAFRVVHGYSYINHWMFTPPTDIKALEKSMDALVDKQERINELIAEALKESAEQLPGGNKSVYVMPAIPEMKEFLKVMSYVSGEVWNKNTIIILIDPEFLEEHLKYTVAHEYHHGVALEQAGVYSVLDRSVMEGKADAFAKMIYPNVEVPWIEPLAGPAKEQAWKLFMENRDSTDLELWYEFFNGNPAKGLPQWSNYKIGYQIMESFQKENPDVSLEEWTKLPGEEILLMSKYKDE
ncbi:DUF2268 domain-containing protein [Paenisporosarcina sp. NPDC076898]|uniref:DUF2268 domain-containing protein n=1 Tax=unclassified Paenisporosarcina TaxID=2642018 RepID=UPI003D05BE4D